MLFISGREESSDEISVFSRITSRRVKTRKREREREMLLSRKRAGRKEKKRREKREETNTMASDFFFLFFFPSLFYPSPPLVGRSAWNLEHRRAIATDPRAFSLITVFRLIRKTRGTLDSPIFVNKKCPVFLGGKGTAREGKLSSLLGHWILRLLLFR